MSCYISFIHYRFNTHSEESICVGMILINKESKKHRSQLSNIKLKIASKILPNKYVFKSFELAVKQLVNYNDVCYEYLERLHIYQNGIIKITKPNIITCDLDRFDSLFYTFIESNFIKTN